MDTPSGCERDPPNIQHNVPRKMKIICCDFRSLTFERCRMRIPFGRLRIQYVNVKSQGHQGSQVDNAFLFDRWMGYAPFVDRLRPNDGESSNILTLEPAPAQRSRLRAYSAPLYRC